MHQQDQLYLFIAVYFLTTNIAIFLSTVANGGNILALLILLESIYLYFPPSSQLLYLCFCPVGLSLL